MFVFHGQDSGSTSSSSSRGGSVERTFRLLLTYPIRTILIMQGFAAHSPHLIPFVLIFAQVCKLASILRKGRIWCLNAGENYKVDIDTWWHFVEEIKSTNVTVSRRSL